MRYSDFQGERISLLGFGAMRLPLLGDGSGRWTTRWITA